MTPIVQQHTLENQQRSALISLAYEYVSAEPAHLAVLSARFGEALPNLPVLERAEWVAHLTNAVRKIEAFEEEREHDPSHFARRYAREELPAARDALTKTAHFALQADATVAFKRERGVA